jgi:TolA-binding protein
MVVVTVSSTACGTMTPRFLMPAPERNWKPTLERAQALAASGRAFEADSTLANYVASYPTSIGAREALYWRSLIQLQSGIVSENGPAMMLERYIGDVDAEHPIEAATLRRVALRVDSLSRVAGALSSKVQLSNGEVMSANNRAADAKSDAKAAVADNKDQDAEIKRLRGELAAAKEELERIKKRLAEPPKKPPVR